ncbi:MAG: helix-turn-helix domain-containing protein [Planctomycetaceae bacterium]
MNELSPKADATHAPSAAEMIRRLEAFKIDLESGTQKTFTRREIRLILKPTSYDPMLVKKTRQALNFSQPLFAQFLGVSVKTVRSWEQGKVEPSDMACRFLDEIRRDPDHWKQRLLESIEKICTENEVGA